MERGLVNHPRQDVVKFVTYAVKTPAALKVIWKTADSRKFGAAPKLISLNESGEVDSAPLVKLKFKLL